MAALFEKLKARPLRLEILPPAATPPLHDGTGSSSLATSNHAPSDAGSPAWQRGNPWKPSPPHPGTPALSSPGETAPVLTTDEDACSVGDKLLARGRQGEQPQEREESESGVAMVEERSRERPEDCATAVRRLLGKRIKTWTLTDASEFAEEEEANSQSSIWKRRPVLTAVKSNVANNQNSRHHTHWSCCLDRNFCSTSCLAKLPTQSTRSCGLGPKTWRMSTKAG